ncbi:MAG: MFS transporter [Rhizobiaceae bacterium]|nr:MAG: MFS transporter [Rhizobiaceae bacterium]
MGGIAALGVAYVLSQFYRSFMAVLTPALTVELGASKAELSLASGAWFAAFALLQFVVGVCLDKYGPKLTVAIMLALCGGGGALVFAVATAPWMIVVAMALLGAGCAPVLMAAMFIFAHSYPPARLAVMTSWLIAFGSAGNVAGTSPLAAAAAAFGWRHVMLAIAVVSVLTGLALMVLVRDPEIDRSAHGRFGFFGFIEALQLRKLWPLIPLVGMNYAPSVGILGLWAGPYLTDVYGANSLLIGHVTLFMAIAVVAGSLIYGPLDTIFGTRKWVAIIGNSGSVLVVAFLAFFPDRGIVSVTAAFVLIGLFGASYALIMAHARAFLPRHLMGRGITLLNFFSMGTVGIMQFLTGAVTTTATVPGKPVVAYSALFGFYAVMLGIAVVIYLFSQDARPEAMESRKARSARH